MNYCLVYTECGVRKMYSGSHEDLRFDLVWVMKRSFFQAAVTSILLYGCTTWTLTKRLEKKLDGNYTRMLRAILNKSWQQHPTRHQLYGHLPSITKTIQVRRTRHAGHCWRSRDELIRDVLLWIPTNGRAKTGRPARTYIQQLCEDTGCCPEDLPRAMNDREEWRERVRDIRAASMIWWWWWLWHINHCRIFNAKSIFIFYTYKQFYYKQFSINTQFSSNWLIDRTLPGATTPGQSRPWSDGSEGVLRITQSSSITGTSRSDCLVSYRGHSLGESYPSAEIQSAYSTAPAD